jgi:CubicO group peptidase (beta-lactamase class C family)
VTGRGLPRVARLRYRIRVDRREFLEALAWSGLAAALPPMLACAKSAHPEPLRATGVAEPKLARFDEWVRAYMAEHRIPGAALAVARKGRVVYARGFGVADRKTGERVEPESRFRIASVSKPITSAAVLRLVEEGRLRLDQSVFDLLAIEPFLAPGTRFDERWRKVTVLHCLTHTGGLDWARSGDPMFDSARIARAMRVPLPVGAREIVRWQLGRPLDFDPGARYAYSNFGYTVLGRVIEAVTGRPYEESVRTAVLEPLGLDGPRIGRSLAEERLPGEVVYYTLRSEEWDAVTGPRAGRGKVPAPYGTWSVEANDACGGWIASAVDLVRFGAAFDLVDGGRATRGGILTPDTVRRMFARHVAMDPRQQGPLAASYGLGWVPMAETGALHNGALVCSAAALLHFGEGSNLAFLANQGKGRDGSYIGQKVADPLAQLFVETRDWPGG